MPDTVWRCTDGGAHAKWTVTARGPAAGGAWKTWATAGGDLVSGTMQSIAPDENTAVRFGLMCMDTRRVRIAMENSAAEFSTLHEVGLLTRTARCDCRHAGQCQADGSCVCPTSAAWPYPKSLSASFGWGGPACNRAACATSIVCSNDLPRGLGICGGPNTCTCPAGWHTTAGANQCTTTECGDGFITTEVPLGFPVEQCDDGNLVNGDGCDNQCQLEQPPEGMVRATRQTPGYLLRGEIIGADAVPPIPPSEETVAATIGIPVERVCCVRVVPATPSPSPQVVPEDEVAYTWTEVYYRPTDDEEEMCKHGGEIRMSDFQPVCQCTPGYFGETCELSLCEHGCDHGSNCIGDDLCSECVAGWEGKYCGTVSNSMRDVVVRLALATAVLLGAAGLVVIIKHAYVPIAARSAPAILVTFAGGIIWLLTAAANIQGESFGYNVDEAAKWDLWMPLVFGAGLWISSSLVYLRTMVVLHIFHHVVRSDSHAAFPLIGCYQALRRV